MKEEEMKRTLITEDELCRRLLVTKACARAWRNRGGGPAWIKVGRLVRYDERAVDEWLQEQTRGNK